MKDFQLKDIGRVKMESAHFECPKGLEQLSKGVLVYALKWVAYAAADRRRTDFEVLRHNEREIKKRLYSPA